MMLNFFLYIYIIFFIILILVTILRQRPNSIEYLENPQDTVKLNERENVLVNIENIDPYNVNLENYWKTRDVIQGLTALNNLEMDKKSLKCNLALNFFNNEISELIRLKKINLILRLVFSSNEDDVYSNSIYEIKTNDQEVHYTSEYQINISMEIPNKNNIRAKSLYFLAISNESITIHILSITLNNYQIIIPEYGIVLCTVPNEKFNVDQLPLINNYPNYIMNKFIPINYYYVTNFTDKLENRKLFLQSIYFKLEFYFKKEELIDHLGKIIKISLVNEFLSQSKSSNEYKYFDATKTVFSIKLSKEHINNNTITFVSSLYFTSVDPILFISLMIQNESNILVPFNTHLNKIIICNEYNEKYMINVNGKNFKFKIDRSNVTKLPDIHSILKLNKNNTNFSNFLYSLVNRTFCITNDSVILRYQSQNRYNYEVSFKTGIRSTGSYYFIPDLHNYIYLDEKKRYVLREKFLLYADNNIRHELVFTVYIYAIQITLNKKVIFKTKLDKIKNASPIMYSIEFLSDSILISHKSQFTINSNVQKFNLPEYLKNKYESVKILESIYSNFYFVTNTSIIVNPKINCKSTSEDIVQEVFAKEVTFNNTNVLNFLTFNNVNFVVEIPINYIMTLLSTTYLFQLYSPDLSCSIIFYVTDKNYKNIILRLRIKSIIKEIIILTNDDILNTIEPSVKIMFSNLVTDVTLINNVTKIAMKFNLYKLFCQNKNDLASYFYFFTQLNFIKREIINHQVSHLVFNNFIPTYLLSEFNSNLKLQINFEKDYNLKDIDPINVPSTYYITEKLPFTKTMYQEETLQIKCSNIDNENRKNVNVFDELTWLTSFTNQFSDKKIQEISSSKELCTNLGFCLDNKSNCFKEEKKKTINIKFARYHPFNNFAIGKDVLKDIHNLLKNKKDIFASNNLFGDPFPGRYKQLTVVLENGKTVTLNENSPRKFVIKDSDIFIV